MVPVAVGYKPLTWGCIVSVKQKHLALELVHSEDWKKETWLFLPMFFSPSEITLLLFGTFSNSERGRQSCNPLSRNVHTARFCWASDPFLSRNLGGERGEGEAEGGEGEAGGGEVGGEVGKGVCKPREQVRTTEAASPNLSPSKEL